MNERFLNLLNLNSKNSNRSIIIVFVIIIIVSATIVSVFPMNLAILFMLLLVFAASILFLRIQPLYLLLLFMFLSFGISVDYSKYILYGFYIVFLYMFIIYLFRFIDQERLEYKSLSKLFYPIIGARLLLCIISVLSLIVNGRLEMENLVISVKYFSIIPLILVLNHYIKNINCVKKIVMLFITLMIVFSLYSFGMLFVSGIESFISFGLFSFRSVFIGLGNPNAVAFIIGLGIPFLFSYLIFGKLKLKKIYILLILLFVMTIFLFWNSRSCYLYIFVASLFLIGFHKNKWKYYFGMAIFFGVVIGYLGQTGILEKLLRLETGLTHRDVLWQAAYRIFLEKPLLGGGPSYFWQNNFYYMDASFGKYLVGADSQVSAHNLILFRAAELGIFAVISVLYVWGYIIRMFYKNLDLLRGKSYYNIYLAFGSVYIGMIVKSLFEAANSIIHLIIGLIILKLIEFSQNQ